MKLHEFTDRLYAMGGIEQKEKRSRSLNESLNEMVQREDMREFMDDFIASMNTLNDKWNPGTWQLENAFEWYIDRCGDTEEDEEWLRSQEDFEESLTEARNPENDEINAAIKRYLASDKTYIPKKDRDLFDKYGITPDKFPRSRGSEKYIQGSNGDVIGQDLPLNVNPDYDFANAVTKQKLDKGDREVPTKDMMYWYDLLGDGPKVSDNDTSKMSSNQFKSLQPYAQEKELIRDTRRRKNRALQDEEERIKAIRDDTERRFKYADEDKERAMKHVRAKRAAKKNESLNLNESKEGLIDYFNELMSTFGVKPYDQVDYLLGYMSESELLDAIDDFKEYMDITDEDIMD